MNKIEKIKKLADAMYNRMQNLTTDTSGIRKAMDEYHQFIINEYYKENTEKDLSVKESVISFGASDSELIHQEIFIPEGFEATIDGNKIILTRIENKDERIRKWLIDTLNGYHHLFEEGGITKEDMLDWLEKQDEQNPTDEEMKTILRTEYEKGRADAIAEMQKEWNEDDEKRLQSCINILKAKSLMGKVDTANTMWLKSLKERIGE